MSDRGGIRKRIRTETSETSNKSDSARKPKTETFFLRFTRRICTLTLTILFVYALYAYYTSPLNSVVIDKVVDVSELEWAKDHNSDLKRGNRILQDLIGPESLVIDNATGLWYTGLQDGRIMEISKAGTPDEAVSDLSAKLVNGPIFTGSTYDMRRPFGLRLKQNILYVADAYQGIVAIDLSTYTWEKIVGYSDVDPPIAFADDLTISDDGSRMYFTDVSVKWPYHLVPYIYTEGDCTGRIIEVELKTKIKHTKILRQDICFPNGIELNPEETVLVVSESARARLLLLDVSTGKELGNVPMPGSCDNVRRAKGGGYWAPIPAPPITVLQAFRNLPFIRDILGSVLGPKGLFMFANLRRGMVAKLNENFEPVAIHYDDDGEVSWSVTEVVELKDGFILCSFIAPGLAKLESLPSRE